MLDKFHSISVRKRQICANSLPNNQIIQPDMRQKNKETNKERSVFVQKSKNNDLCLIW